MKISENYLRYFINEILRENSEDDVGADLVPPEVPFVSRTVDPRSVDTLKKLQNALGVPETGIYDYKTEKAWDNFTYRSEMFSDKDIVGSNKAEIATDWPTHGPKITSLFGNPKNYSGGLRGMLQFVYDVRSWEAETSGIQTPRAELIAPKPAAHEDLPVKKAEVKKGLTNVINVEPGAQFERKFNFHKIKDGLNNYRAGLSDSRLDASPETFKDLNRRYGITTVITLNGDEGGNKIPGHVEAAGLKSIYIPIGSNLGKPDFEKVKAALRNGNTLVHCAHGADRTGGTVGRYYVDEKLMSVEQAYDDMLLYKSGQPQKSIARFVREGPWRSSNR